MDDGFIRCSVDFVVQRVWRVYDLSAITNGLAERGGMAWTGVGSSDPWHATGI